MNKKIETWYENMKKRKLKTTLAILIILLTLIIPSTSALPVMAAGSSWRYPTSDCYVCGNDWGSYYKARPSRPYHAGIDVKSKNGSTKIKAAADGTVAGVGYNSANVNYVVLKHRLSGKTVYSFYAHLKSYCVKKGQKVRKSDKIGKIGNTGSSSCGVHLHFAITDTYKAGSYYGYVNVKSGNKRKYNVVTYYNPHYVISKNKLP